MPVSFPSAKPARRRGFTLIELMVVIAIIGVLVGLLLPAIQAARDAARRSSCQNNSHQIGIAIHAFHDAKRKLPSGGRPPDAATVRFGVFTYLLPYIERKDLFDQYDSSVNWSHANNQPVTSARIGVYECPASPKHGGLLDHNPDGYSAGGAWVGIVAVGDYAASLGNDPALEGVAAALSPPVVVQGSVSSISTAARPTNGFLPKNTRITFDDVTDGLSNTIAVWESGGRPFLYRRGTQVSDDITAARVNAGGWCRPASDILFAGTNATGTSVPGVFLNRANGADVGGSSYGASGYPVWGTEGTSQPYSFHNGGLNVVMGDGSVKFLDDQISIGVVGALVTRNQAKNEPVLSQNF